MFNFRSLLRVWKYFDTENFPNYDISLFQIQCSWQFQLSTQAHRNIIKHIHVQHNHGVLRKHVTFKERKQLHKITTAKIHSLHVSIKTKTSSLRCEVKSCSSIVQASCWHLWRSNLVITSIWQACLLVQGIANVTEVLVTVTAFRPWCNYKRTNNQYCT